MRTKIKQYNGNMRKWVMENVFFIKKRMDKIKDSILKKGHEKMTVMFIPHNEKNIFNFHISKFTILFFVSLFIIIIATSSYAIIKNAAVYSKKKELLSNTRDIRSHLLKFEILTNDTSRLLDKLKPFVEDIYKLTKGSSDSDEIWEYAESDDPADTNDAGSGIPEEIATLHKIQKDLICAAKAVKTMKNFIDSRAKIVNDTPSSIPFNEGSITSYFGWRRSPFGFGREFHSGLDIALLGGKEIRATAPGVVLSSGWQDGYGYMVKIQHKYGYQTIYGHCRENSLRVRPGESVPKGKVIALVGATGRATGEHCHYEIRLIDTRTGFLQLNPIPYISQTW